MNCVILQSQKVNPLSDIDINGGRLKRSDFTQVFSKLQSYFGNGDKKSDIDYYAEDHTRHITTFKNKIYFGFTVFLERITTRMMNVKSAW